MLKAKRSRLVDLHIAGSITRDDYDKKAQELLQRKSDIAAELEGLTKSDQIFIHTLPSLLEVVSRTHEIFKVRKLNKNAKLSISFFRTWKSEIKS